jgi:hypothetical protein
VIVGESDMSEGIGAAKSRLAQARQPGVLAGEETHLSDKGGQDLPLEDAGDGSLSLSLGPQGEKGEGEGASFGGAIEDLPIAQLATPAERDGAGADSAEREGDLA